MARLSRLSVAGVVHYVLQCGHNGGAIVRDTQDVNHLLQALREAALSCGVVLHAYSVTTAELRVLATPDSATGISRMMQALGRRYAAGFNRRHGRRGSLWDGRFRSALVESGHATLQALRDVDRRSLSEGEVQLAARPSPAGAGPEARSSAAQRTGGRRDPALVDPPAYWHLGNTPFDREWRYRGLLAEPLAADQVDALERAVRGNWACGSAAFLASLMEAAARPVAPRPRGRPRRAA